MVRLHAIFASHSSRLQPSLRLPAPAPQRPREAMPFRLAENGVRWTRANNVRSPPGKSQEVGPFCEDDGGSRVARPSDFSPRVSSTSDPHARTFFASRTVGVHSCAHCNRLVLTPRKIHCSHSSGRRCEDADRPGQVHDSTTTRTQEPLRDDVLLSVRISGCAPTRLSEHGGPISLPPHTPLAAELFGVQAAARPGGLLRAMAWRKGCECVRCGACADGEERDLVRCRRTSRPPLAACLSVRARSTSRSRRQQAARTLREAQHDFNS